MGLPPPAAAGVPDLNRPSLPRAHSMTAASLYPGLVNMQGDSILPLLPVGDLRADADRVVVGHAAHGILGRSMAVLFLPWASSAMCI